jgi:hypothetical protein
MAGLAARHYSPPEALDRPRPPHWQLATQHGPEAPSSPCVYSIHIPPLQPNRIALPPRARASLYLHIVLNLLTVCASLGASKKMQIRKKIILDSCRKPRPIDRAPLDVIPVRN